MEIAAIDHPHGLNGHVERGSESGNGPETLHGASEALVEELLRLIQRTVGATDTDLRDPSSLLSLEQISETKLSCSRYLAASQVALYVQKNRPHPSTLKQNENGLDQTDGSLNKRSQTKQDPSAGQAAEHQMHLSYTLSSELSFTDTTVSSTALIKQPHPIDLSRPLSSQIQIITLPGPAHVSALNDALPTTASRYEILHAIVHHVLAPYLNTHTEGSINAQTSIERSESESRASLLAARKKFADLELSLLHLQQSVGVPELHLELPGVIKGALADAKKSSARVNIDLIDPGLLDDSRFLNEMQNTVNSWIKSIQGITKLSRDPESGTALQEISYWLALEDRLRDIDSQTRNEGVVLVLDILQNAKRYQVKLSFYADTGLKEALETVQRYNLIMDKFPMDELLSATEVNQAPTALDSIFNHFNRKLRLTNYPIARALPLVNAISSDLDSQLRRLLQGRMLMLLTFDQFQTMMAQIQQVWSTWDEHAKDFTNIARELMRKRGEKFMPIRVVSQHQQLQDRVAYIQAFRSNHEQLLRTMNVVLGKRSTNDPLTEPTDGTVLIEELGNVDAAQEVIQAYSALQNVDVLDVSVEGTQLWAQAEASYNERIARVENSIIARLRDRLATTKSAAQMFQVFSRFNALFVRPKIRGAIAEYQTQLIEHVKLDMDSLRERFKQRYGNSEAHVMAQLHDLPPISGAIIWARQIDRQLDIYVHKIEDVLGQDWKLHSEGQKLDTDVRLLRSRLDTKPIFDAWLQELQRQRISIHGRLFGVVKSRNTAQALELTVTFDSQIIVLFKEVRNLIWLRCPIPHNIISISKEAKRIYPFAVSLMETVHSITQTSRLTQELSGSSVLLQSTIQQLQHLISTGLNLRWESFAHASEMNLKKMTLDNTNTPHRMIPTKPAPRAESRHAKFIHDIAGTAASFQGQVIIIQEVNLIVGKALQELDSCPYSVQEFQAKIQTIQEAVDRLSLQTFSNLPYWVATLNHSIESSLKARFTQAVSLWIANFEPSQSNDKAAMILSTPDQVLPNVEEVVLKIIMRDQTVQVDPPAQSARAHWINQLHYWLDTILNLPIVRATRYNMGIGARDNEEEDNFSHISILCMKHLIKAYAKIDERMRDIGSYTDRWYQFQSLWDLELDQILNSLGEDLSQWLALLQDIRQTRATFDTSGSKHWIGHAVIEYEQIQAKISARYDQWQHDILNNFASRVDNQSRELFINLQKARRDLEGQTLEASSTSQAVEYITTVQSCRRSVESWEPQIDLFRQSQILLVRQRYQFSTDWLFIDQIDHEYTALSEILARKLKAVSDQTETLKAKIQAEDQVLKAKSADAIEAWRSEKPTSGKIPSHQAISILNAFQRRIGQLEVESHLMQKAKEALDIATTHNNEFPSISEEIMDLSSVWSALDAIWKGLDEMKDAPWSNLQPRKVRQSLESLVTTSKELPSRMRQYAAFEHVQSILRQHLKSIPLLSDLRSEAIRERHWAKIFKLLLPSERFSYLSLTLGRVWELQLISNEPSIRTVIVQAQGEMALEEFMNTVRSTWQGYDLDLVNYQNKCRLIRGWDDLFAKCSENLTSLQAMRNSPYYKEFEEDASLWEDKLNRVHVLFDVWIDVQRQWVYLEGIFSGNADIKQLLPMESARFQNINSEFMAILKKVNKTPQVLDVLNIPGVQKSMDRLVDLLSKIQKALGEYLERERSSFPRFYFVGDEDLLEIIGNAKDVTRVAKHLRKMFAGIAGLSISDGQSIEAIFSSEGERLPLSEPISLAKHPKVNDWLALLESQMRLSLAVSLEQARLSYVELLNLPDPNPEVLFQFLSRYPVQIAILATQVHWTFLSQTALESSETELSPFCSKLESILNCLALLVLGDLDSLDRKRCEHLITELVHQRDILRLLSSSGVSGPDHHLWLLQMRYYYSSDSDPMSRLEVHMANAVFPYGFEYLGMPDRLVRTSLTDRCFLTCTQALTQRLGGSPYGPAGTGKTESVKALGIQLGRFTLVFNCDDTFDFQAMGRIFLGICRVGAWGCFDEFNRLEERILSSVSQQIQNIQLGLRRAAKMGEASVELAGRTFHVHQNTGIFITMNPGYAGRSNLPDNLKKLFRSVAMSKPDKELITEVMLYSQGFQNAKALSRQIVPFFGSCASTLSTQSHYDFGLRALKSILLNSGGLKRSRLDQHLGNEVSNGASEYIESQIIVQSIHETIGPKLVDQDLEKMVQLEEKAFPGVQYSPTGLDSLCDELRSIASRQGFEITPTWMAKALQLYQIQKIHHGIMMVGTSGSGKSTIWKTLLAALQQVEGLESVHHIIDPKVISKETLYGYLDSTTREWTDGLFTMILRKVVDNLRGEDAKRHWIVFDGDVDPEWVENLNSVLDDNKLLTLPNGERINLPNNVRILFEVENLEYATLATVSRCGMVWFNNDVVSSKMQLSHYIHNLKERSLDLRDDTSSQDNANTTQNSLQREIAGHLETQLLMGPLFSNSLNEAKDLDHIMEFTEMRALNSLFSLLNNMCRQLIEYKLQEEHLSMQSEQVETFVTGKLLLALVWAFAGDSPIGQRQAFGSTISSMTSCELPLLDEHASIIDFDMTLPHARWTSWQAQVPQLQIETHTVSDSDVVIPTLDTTRHEAIMYSWLAEHRPLLLCGPPGSGKTMTLFSALRKLENMEVIGINFSSATTPDLLLKVLNQHCDQRKTMKGIVMSPRQIGRWLVIFCDEINLPAADKYGTQRAISFIRQLVEQGGFWRPSDKAWIALDRIQFVGACNPPTDPGRTPMANRFLRHAPLIMVDYPAEISLTQIYGTFNQAILKTIPSLRSHSDAVTEAMIQVYLQSQARFTRTIQPHYVYSPRELSRWVKGLYEAIQPLEALTFEGLVRLWAHEALRLFQDRLVSEEEREWTMDMIKRVARQSFPNADHAIALQLPILYSNWLTKDYAPVERDILRDFVKARLRTFCEEEVDTPIVLFDDVLDHVLRIDRVFRQPQGHLILIGISGSGKTTLSKFVAWMNGMKIFQIKVSRRYTAEHFDDDLREVLRRTGCRGEKMAFIMDESNVLDTAFLERMNTLLANAEVPGLFSGDEYAALMTASKEGAQREGLLLDSTEELYKWFTQQVVKNLHIVFTMNPPQEGLAAKASTSPALFNRCVLNWYGDWSDQALYQVGSELTHTLDFDRSDYQAPEMLQMAYSGITRPPSHRDAIINSLIYVHHSVRTMNARILDESAVLITVTPRHFLDFVTHLCQLYREKREALEDEQRHLNIGLEKLHDTVKKVADLRQSLADKKVELEIKNVQANEKLQKMLADQQEAERRRTASLEVQQALDRQESEVASRKAIVNEDLAKAEPAVLSAQEAVGNIKRQHLTEVRSMGNPPAGVRLALSAVCTLLGHKIDDWKAIQAIVRRDDFISSIVGFDNERQMTKSLRTKMQNEFLSKEDFTFERVNRASKACGPLVQWVEAQVNFSTILDRVGPLRAEADQLEEATLQTKAEAFVIKNNIIALEQSINTYKDEYAILISETQRIKADMTQVEDKVERSVRLLDSLSSEQDRWAKGSQSFENQIKTMVGDVLIGAAFLAYAGIYDQATRFELWENWRGQLMGSAISYTEHNPVIDYLSSGDERLSWQGNGLPADDLCVENAIILKRYQRYPLVIDPSGRALEFLGQQTQKKRPTITSFLDDSCIKQLESALRFGNQLLIQDAEYMDPILNHVLNREYQKTGGRVLINLGKQEIDFSPSFAVSLSTRSTSIDYSPDICSRTTLINFSVTQSSLRMQSLNDVLKAERPDIDQRRTNLVKMQGEFNTHLRNLERQLLEALNRSQGNILEDDEVIRTLETLKKEAAEISKKAAETEGVILQVEKITQQYEAIATACSSIYLVLSHLGSIHRFYQFSLQYFMDIFQHVLHETPKLSSIGDYEERGKIIMEELFIQTYQRTSLALLNRDRFALALLLIQVSACKFERSLWDCLLQENVRMEMQDPINLERAAQRALQIKAFQNHAQIFSPAGLSRFMSAEEAEEFVPVVWDSNDAKLDQSLKSVLMTQLFRPDRFVPAAEKFITACFGDGLGSTAQDLESVIAQVKPQTPICLCSSPGFDASYKVESLVEKRNIKCTQVAMGSREAMVMADAAIRTAAGSGQWVLIKNVHLAPTWLQGLEKQLSSINPRDGLRIFLSMETSDKIPVSLLRLSRTLMFERPAGIRANMKNTLSSIEMGAELEPRELATVYLLLSFLNGVIQERLRYAPALGWRGHWEFNDSDFECCLYVVNHWVRLASQGRTNIAPEKIPWPMLRSLILTIYGGKVDNDQDRAVLSQLIEDIMTSAAFESNHKLVAARESAPSEPELSMPESNNSQDIESWLDSLPEREPPSWLGLPSDSEKMLLQAHGKTTLDNCAKINALLDQAIQVTSTS